MFFEFFRFELRYWLRGFMVYVFLLITTSLFLGAASSDNVVVGESLTNTFRNAPFVIEDFYAIAGILCGLMVTAFVDSAATRDYIYKSHDIVFSKPISKYQLLLGRFLGSTLIAVIPMLGVSLGILLAPYMPWSKGHRFAPVDWMAHFDSICLFAIPNALLVGAVVFGIAVLTRSSLYSFIGTLLFIVAYALSGLLMRDLNNQQLAGLLDPFGIRTFNYATKYWTVDDKNTLHIGWNSILGLNRVLWVTVSMTIMSLATLVFSTSDRRQDGARKVSAKRPIVAKALAPLGPVTLMPEGLSRSLSQFAAHVRNDFRGVVRSTVFIVLVFATLLLVAPPLMLDISTPYGQKSYPVTYLQIERIRGSMSIFVFAILAFFAGVLVWREREAKLHEISGAYPYANWTAYLSKFVSLMTIVGLLQVAAIGVAVLGQWMQGYYRYQLGVYVQELLVIDLASIALYGVLAIFMHALVPNKYIGYFAFIMFIVINENIWGLMRINTLLVKYAATPSYVYSDMFGVAPYIPSLVAFTLYWGVAAAFLLWLSFQIAHRGVASPLFHRARVAWRALSARSLGIGGGIFAVWLVSGVWIYYQTQIKHKPMGIREGEKRLADYEKQYGERENANTPQVTKVQYDIAVYPESRKLVMKGTQQIKNLGETTIQETLVNLAPDYETEVNIEGAKVDQAVTEKLLRLYRFEPALEPGESRSMDFTVTSLTGGIENSVTNAEVNQNGSFINSRIAPQLGYQDEAEISDPEKRKNWGLPPKASFPPLAASPSPTCMHHYLGTSGWVEVDTTISTSSDQIAVAPGALLKRWEENGRNYFQYRLDHRALNFYSFISARYAVEREHWNDVDVEIYYHPEHPWNVPRMKESILKSLDYCSTHFGKYRHRQARIIEFPRLATFAQAFPGTMPYSESIGFIANLESKENIDFVFYVVAHEMAHQWWAHQVVGAKMEGATLLSESLAQYTALMIMEKQYGREMMRKFLQYEVDRYLAGRGREILQEKPLLKVDPNQGYIHYNKASVILYYLKEMIGEDRINLALRNIVERFAYKDPPYPNSLDLVQEIQKQVPEDLQYLIKDLFEEITIFANRTTSASYRKLENGRFAVKIEVECNKFRANDKGKEESTSLADWMEIGAFAKPETGSSFGKELYRKRVFVDQPTQVFEFEVDQLPDQAGIDPYYLLIDRMPRDNLKTVELIEG